MDRHTYNVYGLSVESALPLPPLPPAIDSGSVDVTIRVGDIGDRTAAPTDEDGPVVRDSTIRLEVPGTATFEARGGREIVVEPAPDAEVATIRLYLLGSLMGAVLHQRVLLPIHASAVRLGDSAVAFAADSGGGKSTLAALLHRRGYPLMCDDVVALELMGEGIALHPGVPRLRLTAEALIALGLEASPISPGLPVARAEIPIDPREATWPRTTLTRLYLLDYRDDNEVRIDPLDEWQAFLELRRSIYRSALIRSLVREPEFLRWAKAIVRTVDIFRLGRPRDLSRLEVVLEPLEAHLATPPETDRHELEPA